jgi:hypothetical protein
MGKALIETTALDSQLRSLSSGQANSLPADFAAKFFLRSKAITEHNWSVTVTPSVGFP